MRVVLAGLALALAPAAAGSAAEQPGPYDWGPLPTLGGLTGVSRVEPRVSRAASLVAGGVRVEARCWSAADWSRLDDEWRAFGDDGIAHATGYVNLNDPEPRFRLHLAPDTCRRLALIAYRRVWRSTPRRLYFASSVVRVAHEAQHLRGTEDEAIAECHGLQRAVSVARSLGLTRGQARDLVAVYWRQGYRRLPAAYRSRECRDGGAFDLNLSRSWP